jgi:hypothetical protein
MFGGRILKYKQDGSFSAIFWWSVALKVGGVGLHFYKYLKHFV